MSSVETRAAKPKRPRRIAADEAHAWARNLRLGNPYAKLVLSMLTIYVNGDGSCFVGIDQLAEDCELAQETVRRRLSWLEDVGAVTQFPQWLDASGRRNSEGKGRRTTNDIRLMIESDQEVIEAKARGENADITEDSAEISPVHGTGLNPPPESVSPLIALQQPPHCGGGLTTEPEPEESPLTPLRGAVDEAPSATSEASQQPGEDTWQAFKEAWHEPMQRESIARQVWAAMTEPERQHAITAAKGMHVWRAKQSRPPAMVSAQTFLREKGGHDGYAKHAPPPADSLKGSFVPASSDPGRAMCALRLIAGLPRAVLPTREGQMVQITNDLSPRVLALASFVDERGNRDEKTWKLIEPGSQPFGAWCEYLRAELGAQPIISEVIVGRIMKDEIDPETGQPTGGQVLDRVDRRRGFLAPTTWPPRVDGSLSGTDPPDELSDEDARELARN